MNLAKYLIARPQRGGAAARSLTLADYVAQAFGYNGLDYPFLSSGSLVGSEESIDGTFQGYVEQAYKRNGVVFACIAARLLIFSEARFRFQRLRDGRPGDLFGTPDLDVLERPWTNATTGDLLSRMLLDADLAGNAYLRRLPPTRPGGPWRIKRMRPDWVTIISGDPEGNDPEAAELAGYVYQPGGPSSGKEPIGLLPENVAHFAPYPDPMAQYRGGSWVQSVVREIQGDGASTNHKLKYFEQGATPNLVVTLGDVDMQPQVFQQWVEQMESQHAGAANAYRTLYMAAGADAKVVGSDLSQIDFKAVQGAGETRIAAAARIPPIIVGLSEGLQGSSLNAGNYQAAKRAFADGTIRPMWRNAASSLSHLVNVPTDARLWYDDRDIPFLQEDRKDAVEILESKTRAIRTLTDAGYDPDTVVDAIEAEDMKRLKGAHAGLFSVQLQPPGAGSPSTNGNGSTPALPAPSSN